MLAEVDRLRPWEETVFVGLLLAPHGAFASMIELLLAMGKWKESPSLAVRLRRDSHFELDQIR